MTKSRVMRVLLALSFLAVSPIQGYAEETVSGAGASFPAPLYAKWAELYKQSTDVSVNYQSVGSGAGIKQIKAKTVTFGASDMPLKPEELAESGLFQWPMVIGGVVPVVNLPGVKPGELVLNATVLAEIYDGSITNWDDDKIVALNPKVKLPHTDIASISRSDGSGTTFLFTHYLSGENAEFKEKIGEGSSVTWPEGFGAKGNEGVANAVLQTEGAIGYVEWIYASQNKMTYTRMINKSGHDVTPSAAAFHAAAKNADWVNAPGSYLVITDQPGDETWPISGASFIIMYKNPDNLKEAQQAVKFFDWAFKNGADAAQKLDYVPMPKEVSTQTHNLWKQLKLTAQ